MKVWNVVIHYEGSVDYAVEAETEEEAKEKAESLFETEPAESIIDCISWDVCDCWERKIK